MESGERVSNAWVTYPEVGDNSSKGELIPNVVPPPHVGETKGGILRDLPLLEGPA